MKQRVFVDTNVFLRFFTRDDTGQHAHAAALFRAADSGKITLRTGPPVLFELAWTLRSAYRVARPATFEVIEAILAMAALELTDRSLVEKALARARAGKAEFADAYIAVSAIAAGCSSIATFNRKDFIGMQATVWSWVA